MAPPPVTLVVERVTWPVVIVHGGAGSYLRTTTAAQRVQRGRALLDVSRNGVETLKKSGSQAAVLAAVGAMELDERFNAGRGSKLQRDGRCRLSAALMDGPRTRISAVYNVEGCLHPSLLAAELQSRGDRNLDGTGAQALMEELAWPRHDVRTASTIDRWRDLTASGDTVDPEAAIGDAGRPELSQARSAQLPVPEDQVPLSAGALPDEDNRYGTVGAVAVDGTGQIWACTSTGGRGHEVPGRVSDAPTPTGTYACPQVGVSATGFGEQILDLNVCGRIATRVLDGLDLRTALERTFAEVAAHGGLLGVIAATATGEVGYAHTTEACGVAWVDGHGASHQDRHGRGSDGAR